MRTNVTIGSFVPGTKRPLCGRFVPGNESAWERNVPVPLHSYGCKVTLVETCLASNLLLAITHGIIIILINNNN